MLREFLAFLKAVVTEWALTATNVVVSVSLLVWDANRDDELLVGRRFLWGFVPVTLFLATFLAWRKEHRARRTHEQELLDIRSRQPEGQLKIVVDNQEVYCEVTNLGAQAEFQARLSAPTLSPDLRDVSAVWTGRDHSQYRTITNKHTLRLHLAHFKTVTAYDRRVLDKSPSYAWMICYQGLKGVDWRDADRKRANVFVEHELIIRLISEPELKYPVEANIKLGLQYVLDHENRLRSLAKVEVGDVSTEP